MLRSIGWLAVGSLLWISFSGSTSAREPGWSPVVIARGAYREQIKSLPMEQRPYRPLHFYGNTVRRLHYRGNPLPGPRDVIAPVVVSGSRLLRR